MTPDKQQEVWRRLVTGESLAGLGLGTVEGRIDLRGLQAPEPKVVQSWTFGTMDVARQTGIVVIKGARWEGLDLSGASLPELRFHDTSIENCRFDKAKCTSWRIWATTFHACSFLGANLSSSALGGVLDDRRSAFRQVTFDKANLRGTSHLNADIVDCSFRNAKLKGVEFNGSLMERVVFEGPLADVVFRCRAARIESSTENKMIDVDFRKATFEYVEFIGLEMDRVHWPEAEDHSIVTSYQDFLDLMISTWGSRKDNAALGLSGMAMRLKKRCSPAQKVGVFSRAEVVDAAGEQGFQEFLRLLAAFRSN
jgi:uncharacterized protein YjbI with pentapeptide repeats